MLRLPTRPLKQTAMAAAEHKQEVSSLSLNFSLQACSEGKCSQATDVKGRRGMALAGRKELEGVIFNSAQLLRIDSENTGHLPQCHVTV